MPQEAPPEELTALEDAGHPDATDADCVMVIAAHDRAVLMVMHAQRRRWELPGGALEPGEGARMCAERELREETGQETSSLELRAFARLRDASGCEHGALIFAGDVTELRPFPRNGETSSVLLWRGEAGADIDPVAGVIARHVLRQRRAQPEEDTSD